MNLKQFLRKRQFLLIDIFILVLILVFLVSYFPPRLIFSSTTTTGGDTASHFYTASYLKDVLFPKIKTLGWMQGNYAGFPLFYHYFPLAFQFIALLGLIIPIQVAFKIGTLLGIFLLPICVYTGFRFLRYPFPIPVLSSTLSLVFLFNEGNSLWGGNILSTLAGEFCFSWGLALFVLLMGSIYRGIQENKYILFNALGIGLLGLCHVVPLFFLGVISLFFLLSKRFLSNLRYLALVFGLAFLLIGSWLLPFVWNLKWATSFSLPWQINSFFEIFPWILVPFALLGLASIAINYRDFRSRFLLFALAMAPFVYYISPQIGLLDVRFLPFFQLLLIIFGTTSILRLLKNIKAKQLMPFILFLLVVFLVRVSTNSVAPWVESNYSGFEQNRSWETYSEINNFLKEKTDGRVLYEHTPFNSEFGTMRAFEMLPFFAGRNTLEGLYMMASISSPFVFSIEAETSLQPCYPIPHYFYPTFSLKNAKNHLKLFNVTQFIARTDPVKQELEKDLEFELEKKAGAYAIYRYISNPGEYVEPIQNLPVAFETKNWRRDSHRWFLNSQINDIPLVFNASRNPQFKLKAKTLEDLQRVPINSTPPEVTSRLSAEKIFIQTTNPDVPLLVKVSFHPNWKVQGADQIYFVSPSFMLIFPEKKEVVLEFRRGLINYMGIVLSLFGVAILLAGFCRSILTGQRKFPTRLDIAVDTANDKILAWFAGLNRKFLVAVVVFLGLFCLLFITHTRGQNSFILLKRARKAYSTRSFTKSRSLYGKILERQDNLGAENEALFFYALSFNAEGKKKEALEELKTFISLYPNSFWTPQAFFEEAVIYRDLGETQTAKTKLQQIINQYSLTVWKKYALDILKNIE